MRIQSKVSNLFSSKGEVLVEIPDSSRNCGCPQHECRMLRNHEKKSTKTHPQKEDADTGIVLIPLSFY